jgi:hypothetical protein
MVAISSLFVGSLATCLTTVLAASIADEPKVGYLGVVYKEDTEQVNFILSNGNSAVDFAPLNNGNPVLTSGVGSKHTRDPSLVMDRKNHKNWILATDNGLKAINYNFDYSNRHSSRSIAIYESEGCSLTKWKEARLSPHLVNESFGGIGSPEAIWDDKAEAWLITFTGNMFPAEDKEKTGPSPPSQIWYTHTKDFVTFTKTMIYMKLDGGASDMTIANVHGNTFVRFFRNDKADILKVQGQVSEDGLWGTYKDIDCEHPFVRSADNNGGPLIFPSNDDPKAFYVWVDSFTLGYLPFESDDITKGNFKQVDAPDFIKDIKQGSVDGITKKEYDDLKNAKWTA